MAPTLAPLMCTRCGGISRIWLYSGGVSGIAGGVTYVCGGLDSGDASCSGGGVGGVVAGRAGDEGPAERPHAKS